MFAKPSLFIGLGAGYLLGTRAGRERYDQIVSRAQQVMHDPRVRARAEETREKVADTVSEHMPHRSGNHPGNPGNSGNHSGSHAGTPTTGLDAGMAGRDSGTTAEQESVGTTPRTSR